MLGCCYTLDKPLPPPPTSPPPPVPPMTDTSPSFVGSASLNRRVLPVDDGLHLTFSMTDLTKWQTSALWWSQGFRVDVTHSFEFHFQAFFGGSSGGGEGIVFAIQTDGTNALETTGGHFLGYGYKDGNQTSYNARVKTSVGIEFDTDEYLGEFRNEISANHIAILKDGDILRPIKGPVQAKTSQSNIKDNQWHDIWIRYLVGTNQLSVYFDDSNTARITATINIRDVVLYDVAYWGFTASTGELTNFQKVTLHKSAYLKYL